MKPLKILGLGLAIVLISLLFLSLRSSGHAIGRMAGFFAYMSVACTIIPLPTPPYAIAMGRDFHPLLVALVGALGNCLAALIEYKLLTCILSETKLRARIEASRLFGLFRRQGQATMFGALLLGGFTPIPFEPFRLTAILLRYHQGRFLAAVFISRYLHYYLIALLGHIFSIPNRWLAVFVAVLFVVAAIDILRGPARSRTANNPQ